MRNGGGRSGTLYHMSDINVYLGRQSGGRPLSKRERSRNKQALEVGGPWGQSTSE